MSRAEVGEKMDVSISHPDGSISMSDAILKSVDVQRSHDIKQIPLARGGSLKSQTGNGRVEVTLRFVGNPQDLLMVRHETEEGLEALESSRVRDLENEELLQVINKRLAEE